MAITTHQSKLSTGKTLQKAVSKIFSNKDKNELRISELINIDAQIETFRKAKLSMVNRKRCLPRH